MSLESFVFKFYYRDEPYEIDVNASNEDDARANLYKIFDEKSKIDEIRKNNIYALTKIKRIESRFYNIKHDLEQIKETETKYREYIDKKNLNEELGENNENDDDEYYFGIFGYHKKGIEFPMLFTFEHVICEEITDERFEQMLNHRNKLMKNLEELYNDIKNINSEHMKIKKQIEEYTRSIEMDIVPMDCESTEDMIEIVNNKLTDLNTQYRKFSKQINEIKKTFESGNFSIRPNTSIFNLSLKMIIQN
jgi:hypothetical protein